MILNQIGATSSSSAMQITNPGTTVGIGHATEIVIDPSAGYTALGEYAFFYCSSLTSITLPASVTSIGSGAFQNCSSLTSITLPANVTSIGDWAFSYCSSLTSITIPANVTSIGSYAFYGCSSLTALTCLADTPPTLQYGSLSDMPAACAIKVPAASVAAYQAASYWSDRAAYISAI